MPNVTYQPSTDPDIEKCVHRRYEKEIVALRQLGFEPWFILEELLFPFSLFISLIIIPLLLVYRQTLRVKSPLRMALYDQALTNPSQGAIAFLGGLGVKFYTQFTDGSLLISGVSVPTAIESDSFWFYPVPRGGDLAAAWRFHQQKLETHLASGKQIKPISSFEEYLQVDQRSAAAIAGATMYTPSNQGTILKATRYLYFLITLISTLGLLFFAPILLQRDPVGGIGYILLGLVTAGNMGMATWDTFKNRSDEIFFFPKTARWAKILADVLLVSFIVTFVLRMLQVIPSGSFYLPLAGVWFVYTNCMSLYFRIRRQINGQ